VRAQRGKILSEEMVEGKDARLRRRVPAGGRGDAARVFRHGPRLHSGWASGGGLSPYNGPVTTQDDVFVRSEGDRWFERNAESLAAVDLGADVPLRLAELYGLKPSSVLEVGAANGYRLHAFHQRYGCRVVGVDVSAAAIADGQARFPEVQFHRARGHRLPVREEFDLVVTNFVLHWVDRRHLLQSLAEIDRATRDGGFVIIGDFLPRVPARRAYHHLAGGGVFTYKQDYAEILLATGLYRTVAMLSSDHATHALSAAAAEDERVGTWLLAKDVAGPYVEG